MVYGRFQQKTDTSANWAKATNFVPLEGEIIIYSDLNQHKIGDGKTKVNDLPFEGVLVKGAAANSAVLAGSYEGYKNEAISQISMALGAATTAGLKGWFYDKVDLTNKKIRLVTTQPRSITIGTISDSDKNTAINSGYAANDVISIVNSNKYENCSAIDKADYNILTLKTLPFDSSTIFLKNSTLGGLITLDPDPDEFTLYCVKKYNKGKVDLGGGCLAEGVNTLAINIGAHAEGIQTIAYGQYSHTEGFKTEAGYSAHAEGKETKAVGEKAHAEGMLTQALGLTSHAEGHKSIAEGDYSHAEGFESKAIGDYSHTEGVKTEAKERAHAEGDNTKAYGSASHAEGYITEANGPRSHAEGDNTYATANGAHSEGKGTVASGEQSHAEGRNVQAIGHNSHAEGDVETSMTSTYNREVVYIDSEGQSRSKFNDGYAHGHFSHREGRNTSTAGDGAHAEGNGSMAIGNSSHAEGYKTTAILGAAHSEGYETRAEGMGAHAEGYNTTAKGESAHAEGSNNTATGTGAHVEGLANTATGYGSHAEGSNTRASGVAAHVEGKDIRALATGAHAEGGLLTTEEATYKRKVSDATGTERSNDGFAHGEYSHREGRNTSTYGNYSHTEGSGTMALGNASHAEGYNTTAINSGSHAEGYYSTAAGKYSHAEGGNTNAEGEKAHAEGSYSTAAGLMSHAEGINTKAGVFERKDLTVNPDTSDGAFTHAEGNGSIAVGNSSHAEGRGTFAEGWWSHTEGFNSWAAGRSAHAEGDNTKANADGAHAEGTNVKANDENGSPVYYSTRSAYYIKGNKYIDIEGSLAANRGSHAEGVQTFAGEYAAHAEGFQTDAVGQASHAEGWQTRAEGKGSHASGIGTKATKDAQTVVGYYNNTDDNANFIVGVGTKSKRQNAFSTGKDTNDNCYLTVGQTKLTETELQKIKGNSSQGTSDNSSSMQFIEGGQQLTLPSDVNWIYSLGNKIIGFSGTSRGSDVSVYVSTDLGQTWQDNTSTLPEGLRYSDMLSIYAAESKLFVSNGCSPDIRLFVTEDGMTWCEIDLSSIIPLGIDYLYNSVYFNGLWYLDLYYGVYCVVNSNNQIVAADHVPSYSAAIMNLTVTREGVLACCQEDISSSYYRLYNITTGEIIETNIAGGLNYFSLSSAGNIVVLYDSYGLVYISQDDGHTFTEADSAWGDVHLMYNNIYCGYYKYSDDNGASWKELPEELRCYKKICQDTLIGIKSRKNPTTNRDDYYLIEGYHPAKMSTTTLTRVVQEGENITLKLKEFFATV